MPTRHRTTLNLNLDVELVAEAQRILGASRATDTVHRALRDVIDRERRRQLLELSLGDLTPERLEELRRPRSFETADIATQR